MPAGPVAVRMAWVDAWRCKGFPGQAGDAVAIS